VFSFAMIVADNAECVGVVAFARSDFEPGDVLPQGPAGNLRVVNVLESAREDRLPVFFVELAPSELGIGQERVRP
jgi:hypothetical protein